MNKTIKLAKELNNKKENFCAIIIDRKGRILSYGFNSYSKTSPQQKEYACRVGKFDSIFNHAEIDAIRKIQNGIPYAIYIARVNKNEKILLSKPCEICSLAINEIGIKEKNIFYTK